MGDGAVAAGADSVIGLPSDCRIFVAAGFTDLRKGFDGLSALVESSLREDPYCGALYVFRGRRGDKVKIIWYDGQGLCLFYKRLEDGTFVWPRAANGVIALSSAQLSMLIEGIDWRRPKKAWRPRPSIPEKDPKLPR